VEGLDGLVLSGGPDVDPARYDAAPDPHTGAPRTERDAWEIALTAAALRRDMPLLGVCRGMQVLAVALGGTLAQHLPDDVGTEVHCPTVGVHGRHPVNLAPSSRLGAVLGTQTEVATYHHQAVATLPEATKAIGWAADGTVEAFEVCGAAWAFGVQWHPEVHDGQALFADFVAACGGVR
jgi:putative glutamine amidotransferase